jgi:hypothetical protein
VVINELVADPLPADEDWIEFYNADSVSVDLAGWRFSDGGNNFTFPMPTSLAAGAYLVLDRNDPNSFTFGFSKVGETISLYTDTNQLVDSTSWVDGDADQPNSWGRLPNGSGTFQTLSPTKNGANQ